MIELPTPFPPRFNLTGASPEFNILSVITQYFRQNPLKLFSIKIKMKILKKLSLCTPPTYSENKERSH